MPLCIDPSPNAMKRVCLRERARTGIVTCAEEGGAGCWFSMQSRCVCRGAERREREGENGQQQQHFHAHSLVGICTGSRNSEELMNTTLTDLLTTATWNCTSGRNLHLLHLELPDRN